MGNASPDSLTDLELFARTSDGDEDAFLQIVNRYKNQLYNFLRRMVSDSTEAEDLLQQTFIRVHKKSVSGCKVRSFSSWIFTIAANLARDELRRKKRVGRNTSSLEEIPSDAIPDPKSVLIDGIAQSELRERIEWAVGNLDEKYRTVFVLRDIEGKSYEEIAQVLEVRIGTVKSRLNRARLRLQTLLSPYLKEGTIDEMR
jgi:RNA polymerase sigma-70 factor (ECF subfamily)